MRTRFEIDTRDGVSVGIARGALTLEQSQEAAVALWRRAPEPPLRVLWDLCEARFDLTPDEVRRLAEFIKENAPPGDLRTAFLVSGDLEFGLVRMFEVFRETPDAKAAAFRDRESALAWLSGDAT